MTNDGDSANRPKSLPIASEACETDTDCCGGVDRRDFIKLAGLSSALAATAAARSADAQEAVSSASAEREVLDDSEWPVVKVYGPEHVDRVALPLGGIGTGTVSLTGFGSLRDWEVVNRPAKGFTPTAASPPLFAVFVDDGGQRS